MKITEFTTGMKLSDLLISNPQLILMLPRFGLGLGFGDKKVSDDPDLIIQDGKSMVLVEE